MLQGRAVQIDEHTFLASIASRAALPRDVPAAAALAVTLCTLADRLTPGQAHRLLDALPAVIRPLVQSCRVQYGRPVARLDDAGFLEQLSVQLAVTPAHAELIAHAVFRAVRAVLPDPVIAHVADQLPKTLRDLWLGTRAPLTGVATGSDDDAQHALLSEIAARVPLPTGIGPAEALAAVLCAFGQRLSGGEARDLFLGLPHPVRPLVEHCLVRHREHAAVFGRTQLVSRVADELGVEQPHAEQIVGVVLTAVKRLLPTKEQYDVASQLPPDLRATWETA